MTKIIAILALTVIAVGSMLGNFWLTYGLWPRSWAWFVFFGFVSVVVTTAMSHVMKDEE